MPLLVWISGGMESSYANLAGQPSQFAGDPVWLQRRRFCRGTVVDRLAGGALDGVDLLVGVGRDVGDGRNSVAGPRVRPCWSRPCRDRPARRPTGPVAAHRDAYVLQRPRASRQQSRSTAAGSSAAGPAAREPPRPGRLLEAGSPRLRLVGLGAKDGPSWSASLLASRYAATHGFAGAARRCAHSGISPGSQCSLSGHVLVPRDAVEGLQATAVIRQCDVRRQHDTPACGFHPVEVRRHQPDHRASSRSASHSIHVGQRAHLGGEAPHLDLDRVQPVGLHRPGPGQRVRRPVQPGSSAASRFARASPQMRRVGVSAASRRSRPGSLALDGVEHEPPGPRQVATAPADFGLADPLGARHHSSPTSGLACSGDSCASGSCAARPAAGRRVPRHPRGLCARCVRRRLQA